MCMVYLFPVMFLFVGFCLCSRSFLKEGPLLPDSLKQGIFLEDSPSKTVFSPRNFLQKMFCFIYFLTRFVIDLNAKIYFPFVICCCCAWVKFQAPVKIVYLVHCFTLFFIVVHCEMKKIFSLKKKCIEMSLVSKITQNKLQLSGNEFIDLFSLLQIYWTWLRGEEAWHPANPNQPKSREELDHLAFNART